MVSQFDRRFRSLGFPMLLREFGEPAVYHFRGGGKRPINAIIARDPPAFYNAAGEVILPDFGVRFPNDHFEGVTAEEIDTGDFIELIPELGGEKRIKVTVMKLQSQDGGVCSVACKGPQVADSRH